MITDFVGVIVICAAVLSCMVLVLSEFEDGKWAAPISILIAFGWLSIFDFNHTPSETIESSTHEVTHIVGLSELQPTSYGIAGTAPYLIVRYKNGGSYKHKSISDYSIIEDDNPRIVKTTTCWRYYENSTFFGITLKDGFTSKLCITDTTAFIPKHWVVISSVPRE